MKVAAAIVALAGVGLVGTSGAASIEQATSSKGWTRTDLRPVTQPAPVAGRFVVLAVAGGHLSVVALDARTGATVWSQTATPSHVTTGVPPGLTLSAGNVIFIAPAGANSARLMALDGRTGRPVWRSAKTDLKSWPGPCADPPPTICATRRVVTGGKPILRFDAATGKLLATTGVEPAGASSTREVGAGLYDTGSRSPEKIEALAGSRIAWVRPLARIFPIAGVSTDWGWNFDRVEAVGRFVGSAGSPLLVQSSTGGVEDMARTMTAGFRISDGSVRWRSRGTFDVCGLFPCPGSPQAGYSRAENGRSPSTRIVVVMRRQGRLTGSIKNGKPSFAVSPGTKAALEGVDPAHGRVRWALPLEPDPEVLAFYALPPLVGPSTVALRSNGKLVAVRLLDGSTATLPPGPAWCRNAITYELADPSGGARHTYIGQYSLTPCTAGGDRVDTPARVQAFVGRVGAAGAGLAAWSDTTGVFARPIAR